MREKPDGELIDMAKMGNQSAFNELARRHRSKAVHWAKQITNDAYLADDVAQDALLRSYLYLESLRRSDRFLPWLKNIVRNKAIDHIRKKRRERQYDADMAAFRDEEPSDPELAFLDEEAMASVSNIISSLSEKSRRIFEAHFFHHMPPGEIAVACNTNVGNVYNIISRAKTRLREKIYANEIERYIAERRAASKSRRNSLAPPDFRSVYVSMGYVLHQSLNYTSLPPMSIGRVMGLSGQAFRIQMTEDAGVSSSFIYDWKTVFHNIADVFGLGAASVGEPNRSLTPDLLLDALKMVHRSIDDGIPAMVWNLIDGEFGLFTGYDDDKGMLVYNSASHTEAEAPFHMLAGSSDNPELFVAVVRERGERNASRHMLVRALRNIVRHSRGEERTIGGYTHGLAAYDVWIRSLESGSYQPIGHAYNASLLAEAREQALSFLRELATEDPFGEDPESARLLHEAIRHFAEVVSLCHRLYPGFPFGMAGFPVGNGREMADLLAQIRSAETRGVQCLEQILKKNG